MIFFSMRSIIILVISAITVTVSVFLFTTQSVFAHGEGVSVEKEVGNYFIDIGYDSEVPETGTPVRLDFELSDKTSGATVVFSSVWVRIEKEKQTVFASGIHRPEFGKTGLMYTFGEPGTYTISARFQNNEDNIAETSFPLTVSGALSPVGKYSTLDTSVLWGVFGLIMGVVLSFVIKRKVNNL